jgi:pimeloyl-ACP methyl ester carboxylesterase
MFPSFLPSDVELLTESTSIALAQQIEQQDILTSLSDRPISTSFVHQGSGGTPILLLHGFDSSVFEFRRLLPLLAPDADTWAVDLLGFGFTSRLPEIAITPMAIKTHLYEFWTQLIQQPMILVGVSMGGAAALDFTLSYPNAVQKLVLIDSAGFAKGPAMGKIMFPPLGYLATQFLRNPRIRQQISLKAYCDRQFASADASACASLHLQMPGWDRGTIAFTKSGGYNFLADKIQQVDKPTLILWGENDQILGTGDAEKFAQAIAGSKLIWIPNCGHVPHLEQPQVSAEQILQWRNS